MRKELVFIPSSIQSTTSTSSSLLAFCSVSGWERLWQGQGRGHVRERQEQLPAAALRAEQGGRRHGDDPDALSPLLQLLFGD